MVTKETVIDKKEILENGIIQIREVTKIIEDGEEIAKQYKRWCLCPGQDVSDQTQAIKDLCNFVWTEEIVQNYISNNIENMI